MNINTEFHCSKIFHVEIIGSRNTKKQRKRRARKNATCEYTFMYNVDTNLFERNVVTGDESSLHDITVPNPETKKQSVQSFPAYGCLGLNKT